MPAIDNRRKYITAPRDLAAAHCRAAAVIENRCEELMRTHPGQAGEHAAMYISAALLRTFAIELAMKSLIYAEQSTWQTGHPLQMLFDKLTTQSRNEIANIASNNLSRPFTNALSEISTVFEDWRYIHQKFGEGADLGFDTDEMKIVAHAVLHVLDTRIATHP